MENHKLFILHLWNIRNFFQGNQFERNIIMVRLYTLRKLFTLIFNVLADRKPSSNGTWREKSVHGVQDVNRDVPSRAPSFNWGCLIISPHVSPPSTFHGETRSSRFRYFPFCVFSHSPSASCCARGSLGRWQTTLVTRSTLYSTKRRERKRKKSPK